MKKADKKVEILGAFADYTKATKEELIATVEHLQAVNTSKHEEIKRLEDQLREADGARYEMQNRLSATKAQHGEAVAQKDYWKKLFECQVNMHIVIGNLREQHDEAYRLVRRYILKLGRMPTQAEQDTFTTLHCKRPEDHVGDFYRNVRWAFDEFEAAERIRAGKKD